MLVIFLKNELALVNDIVRGNIYIEIQFTLKLWVYYENRSQNQNQKQYFFIKKIKKQHRN